MNECSFISEPTRIGAASRPTDLMVSDLQSSDRSQLKGRMACGKGKHVRAATPLVHRAANPARRAPSPQRPSRGILERLPAQGHLERRQGRAHRPEEALPFGVAYIA